MQTIETTPDTGSMRRISPHSSDDVVVHSITGHDETPLMVRLALGDSPALASGGAACSAF